jgi:hypothetical protein
MRLQVNSMVSLFTGRQKKAKRTAPSATAEIEGVGSFTVSRDRDKQIILYKDVNYDFNI